MCAHLLIIGIGLVVAQVFQTLIHNRLKKVGWLLILSENFENAHVRKFDNLVLGK